MSSLRRKVNEYDQSANSLMWRQGILDSQVRALRSQLGPLPENEKPKVEFSPGDSAQKFEKKGAMALFYVENRDFDC